jgi:uncharacterized membrane protein YhiD involved in acid resistance
MPGIISGGGILKRGRTVLGTVTAASLWATDAIGVGTRVTVAASTFLTLKLAAAGQG